MLIVGVLGLVAPAQAVNFTVTSTPYTAGAPTTTQMCADAVCEPRWSGDFAIVTGSVVNKYLKPAGLSDTDKYVVVPDPLGSPGGSADLSFVGIGPLKSISFLWGSIGPATNALRLYHDGNVNPFVVNVAGLISNNPLETAVERINRWVTITGDQSFMADRLNFSHTGRAAEMANFGIDVVPEPSSWAMMIAGFGLVGASARRRQTVTPVCA
jgi:hypothetical protein